MPSTRYVWGSLLFLVLAHCSSKPSEEEEQREQCRAVCKDRCDAYGKCGFVTVATCADSCANSLQHADCRGEIPADQYTCDELEEVYVCAQYCATFCARVPECGSFNQQYCLEGCSFDAPSLCNPASVAARTCDELKPEARSYDEGGRLLQGDGEVHHYTSPFAYQDYGLCRETYECTLPETCLLATNTCGACTQNSDCSRGTSSPYLCMDGECLDVDCITDDDCLIGICDPEAHACVECLSDANCTGTWKACNLERQKCAECTTDAHCTREGYPVCDPKMGRCVQCRTDADCKNSLIPVCGDDGYCTTS
jgi:hypothetical protein